VCFVLPFSLGWRLGVGIVRSPDRRGLKVSAVFYRRHGVKRARAVLCSEWLLSLFRVASASEQGVPYVEPQTTFTVLAKHLHIHPICAFHALVPWVTRQ
jgi:hypothetical protein